MNYSKDGVTVAAMFDTAHPKKSGKCPVKIRVTYNRVRNYYPTGKDLSPEEWEILPTTKVRALVAIRKDIEKQLTSNRAGGRRGAGRGRCIYTQQTEYAAKRCTFRHGKHSISGKNGGIKQTPARRQHVDIRQCSERLRTVCPAPVFDLRPLQHHGWKNMLHICGRKENGKRQ